MATNLLVLVAASPLCLKCFLSDDSRELFFYPEEIILFLTGR